MKLLAALVGCASLVACAAGLWLALRTLSFALGPDYALFHGVGPGDGTGFGIFLPAVLLLGLGWYLARFARNLWAASEEGAQGRSTLTGDGRPGARPSTRTRRRP